MEAETGFAAEIDGELVGFMTIDPAGHLDLAFVAPSAAGRGVGRRLHEAVEARARASGASEMTAEVSPAARSFFGRRGWETLTEQVVIRHGVPMTDFRMRKALELVSAISR